MAHTIRYIPLDEVPPADVNPKRHDLPGIIDSIRTLGFGEPPMLDGRTNKLVAGHGRIEALVWMRDNNEPVPQGIDVDDDGTWTAPIVYGWSSDDDAHAAAYLAASNVLTERGGWDPTELATIAPVIGPDLLPVAGFGDIDLVTVKDHLRVLPGDSIPLTDIIRAGSEIENEPDANPADYTSQIVGPVYEPTMPEPPAVSELTDQTKTDALLASIDAADLDPAVAQFLRTAAERHTVFRYAAIAEFYAHATAEVQELMESSGLVIVDFDAAVENGFVQMSTRLADLYREQTGAVDA